MDLNKVMLIGNLTRDPESRTVGTGSTVTSFSIAVNRRVGKDKPDEVMFIKIETWDRTAELAKQYLLKGSQVLVEGRLKLEEYESRDGQKRRDPVVVANHVSFGSKPREGGAPSGGGNYGGGGAARESSSSSYGGGSKSRQSEPEYERAPDYDQSQGGGQTEDDLPF